MLRTHSLQLFLFATISVLLASSAYAQEENGKKDLEDAMRAKVTAENLDDLGQVIILLATALDKGLDEDDAKFAQKMLSDSLLERARGLLAALEQVPPDRIAADQRLREQFGNMTRQVVSDLRTVLQDKGSPPLAKLLMGRVLVKFGGDKKQAKQMLDQFFQQIEAEEDFSLPLPEIADAYMLRAVLQEDRAESVKDVSRAIELDTNSSRYLLARAALYGGQREFEKALKDVAEAIKLQPNDDAAYLVEAEVYQAQGRTDDAFASLDRATEAVPDAWKPYQYRAQLLRGRGDLEAAIQAFSEALQRQEPALAETLVARAEAYMESRKFDEALNDIESALAQRPGWITGLRLKAQVLASGNKLADAIAVMREILDAGVDAPEVHMQLALYYLVNQQPRQSISEYSKVIAQQAENFDALRHRGDAYINIGEHRLAIEDFEKAIKLKPDDSLLLNNLAWLLCTSPEEDIRDGDRALELAEKACELTKYEEAFILSTLAAAYAEQGDFAKAREWSQKAVDANQREDQAEQIRAELESYQQGKPWRERQQTAEEEAPVESDDATEDSEPAEQSIDF